MNPFPSYTIHHIYLNNTLAMPRLEVEGKGNYLVFWWKDVGLGHFFIEPDQALTEDEYFEQLKNIVRPTIEFYLKDTNIAGNDWEYWLTNKMYEDFYAWMDKLLSKFIAVKIPAIVPVSVIICTRNRAPYLKKCLTTLTDLVCNVGEIVVVDNAPVDDSTKNVVENFHGVKYIREPRPGLDIARNTGILNTTLPIIAYVDDDVYIHYHWAYHVWNTFRDPAVGAMTGLVFASELTTEAQLIFEKHWSFNRGYIDKIYDNDYFTSTLTKGPKVWEIGAGANMAFRRSVFEKTGLFNELLDAGAAGCNGDSEMWFRALSSGQTIYYNPRAVVYHEHRKDLKGLKKQIFYYMRGFTTAALIQKKLRPESGYVKYNLLWFPSYYRQLLIKGFPYYRFRFRTLWNEITGTLSGLRFFYKNRRIILRSVPYVPNPVAPLVSVIVPCYNHGKYLMDALKSIWEQDYEAIEIIVVDDGSTDNTREILKEIKDVKYIYQDNQGPSAARNNGIKNSKGEFLVFLDADDWLLSGSVAFNLSYLLQDDTIAFVSGAHEKIFVENGGSVDVAHEINNNHYLHFLHGNYVGMHATIMFRRWVFDHFIFDETLKGCEDYDLYLKITRKFPVLNHIQKIAAYRIHNANNSRDAVMMLSKAIVVLERQKESLQSVEEELAYENGLKTWKEYYSSQQ